MLFKFIWTSFWVFVLSLVAQGDSPKTFQERVEISIGLTIMFTPIILGYVVLVGEYLD